MMRWMDKDWPAQRMDVDGRVENVAVVL